MNAEILRFFGLQRKIFGICPHSGKFFRLSDAKLYSMGRPPKDWKERLDTDSMRLEALEVALGEKEERLREKARRVGRTIAQKLVRKFDRVFRPHRYHPDDAKVLFHPVDYLLFQGMNTGDAIRDVAFLDRETKDRTHRDVQRSIERAVSKGQYEWLTLRVKDDGGLVEE